MKKTVVVSLFCWAALAVHPAAQSARTFVLSGEVVDRGTAPWPGVAVVVEGGGISETVVSDDQGGFAFRLPPGEYRVKVSGVGFYETVIKGIEVRNEDLHGLRIILHDRLPLRDPAPETTGPEFVPSPPLEVTVEATAPVHLGRPVRLTVTLRNRGTESVKIPRRAAFDGDYTPQLLLMRFEIEVYEYDAVYSGAFVCLPSRDCPELAPGEATSLTVDLFRRNPYMNDGLRRPQRHHLTGTFGGAAEVHFTLPHKEGERETRTRPIRQLFRMHVE